MLVKPQIIDIKVNKANLTVTVDKVTATYGDPVPTYTVKYEGFVNNEDKNVLSGTLDFACNYVQFSNKGDYTIKQMDTLPTITILSMLTVR